jgi:hypothetical protein
MGNKPVGRGADEGEKEIALRGRVRCNYYSLRQYMLPRHGDII